jgi:hypothetical protein
MSLALFYQWQSQLAALFPHLHRRQLGNLALLSLGIVLAQHSAITRIAEGLALVGKPETVRRRLERFLANPRLDGVRLCQAWTRWVLKRLDTPHPVLVVDETALGPHLRVMVIGLAYQSCCLPLVFWCYCLMPLPQVHLITTLLDWVSAVLPAGCQPLLQADRGIGTSPELIRALTDRAWHYLFRVQNDVRLQTQTGSSRPLKHLVKPGEHWRGRGLVFKKAGWLPATVLVVWQAGCAEPWCLVTNAPDVHDFSDGLRSWQEAAFRDLKSDGWQWQRSRVWTPDHAQILLLGLTLAYAYTLTLGQMVLQHPPLFRLIARPGKRQHFSLFRLGLRLWRFLTASHTAYVPSLFSPCLDPPLPLCVGV